MPEQIFTEEGLRAYLIASAVLLVVLVVRGFMESSKQRERLKVLRAETDYKIETGKAEAAASQQKVVTDMLGLLQTTLQQRQSELDTVRTEYKRQSQEQSDELCELSRRFEEEMTKREQLEQTVKDLQRRLEEAERQLHLKEEENKKLQNENSTLHNDNESLRKKIENLKFELDQVRKELDLVKEQLGQGDFKLDGRQTNS